MRRIFMTLCILPGLIAAQALNDSAKSWDYYISIGGGFSTTRGIPQDIYQAGNSNVQAGVWIERKISTKYALLSGVEIEQITYSFDGLVDEDNNTLNVIQAPGGVKYTQLYNRNISLPLQVRWHYKDSQHSENLYLQGGLRVAYGWNATFSYREGGESQNNNLTPALAPVIVSAEFMIGFKGNYFSNFDILNASSLGVIATLNPIFDSALPLQPFHFTWRFMF
jgi:hypothetical protein